MELDLVWLKAPARQRHGGEGRGRQETKHEADHLRGQVEEGGGGQVWAQGGGHGD